MGYGNFSVIRREGKGVEFQVRHAYLLKQLNFNK